jgi:hypothetical protein
MLASSLGNSWAASPGISGMGSGFSSLFLESSLGSCVGAVLEDSLAFLARKSFSELKSSGSKYIDYFFSRVRGCYLVVMVL